MNTILLKCRICDNWYRPSAHNYHCPTCAAMPMVVARNQVKYYHLLERKAVEIVRGIPRYNFNNAAVARTLGEE